MSLNPKSDNSLSNEQKSKSGSAKKTQKMGGDKVDVDTWRGRRPSTSYLSPFKRANTIGSGDAAADNNYFRPRFGSDVETTSQNSNASLRVNKTQGSKSEVDNTWGRGRLSTSSDSSRKSHATTISGRGSTTAIDNYYRQLSGTPTSSKTNPSSITVVNRMGNPAARRLISTSSEQFLCMSSDAELPPGRGTQQDLNASTNSTPKFDWKTYGKINGPRYPKFSKKYFKIDLLKVDDRSVLTIRIKDDDSLALEKPQKLEEVLKAMLTKRRISPPYEDIEENGYYLAISDTTLHRVKVLQKNGIERPLSCIDIDSCYPVEVYGLNIALLRPSTIRYPRKVIECELYGLELLRGTNVVQQVFWRKKLPQEYLCKFEDQKENELPLISLTEIGKPSYNIVEMIRVLIPQLCKLTLPKEMSPVKIVHLEQDGRIFLHPLRNFLLEKIERFLYSFIPENYPVELPVLSKELIEEIDNPEMIYIAKYDGAFTRVKVQKVLHNNKVVVEYVDYGNLGKVPMSDLLHIQMGEKTLCIIPPQCFHIKLPKIGYIANDQAVWSLEEFMYLSVDSESGLPRVSLLQNDSPPDNLEDYLLKMEAAFASKPEPKVDANSAKSTQEKSISSPAPTLSSMTVDSIDTSETASSITSCSTLQNKSQEQGQIKYEQKYSVFSEEEEEEEDVVDDLPVFSICKHQEENQVQSQVIVEDTSAKKDDDNSVVIANEGEKRSKTAEAEPIEKFVVQRNCFDVETFKHQSAYMKSDFVTVGSLTVFRITDFQSPDDFCVQLPDTKQELLRMEEKLKDFCNGESKLPVSPSSFSDYSIFALYHSPMRRWIRCVLFDKEKTEEGAVKLQLRTLDYGFMIKKLFEKLEDWKSLQILGPPFFEFSPHGYTCSRFMDPLLPMVCDNPTINLKNRLVKAYVRNILTTFYDIGHMDVLIVEILEDVEIRGQEKPRKEKQLIRSASF